MDVSLIIGVIPTDRGLPKRLAHRPRKSSHSVESYQLGVILGLQYVVTRSPPLTVRSCRSLYDTTLSSTQIHSLYLRPLRALALANSMADDANARRRRRRIYSSPTPTPAYQGLLEGCVAIRSSAKVRPSQSTRCVTENSAMHDTPPTLSTIQDGPAMVLNIN